MAREGERPLASRGRAEGLGERKAMQDGDEAKIL